MVLWMLLLRLLEVASNRNALTRTPTRALKNKTIVIKPTLNNSKMFVNDFCVDSLTTGRLVKLPPLLFPLLWLPRTPHSTHLDPDDLE
jgi:hypothetical protein